MSVLGLLFTRNVSLETWVRTGLLDREKMIYESEIEQGLYEEITNIVFVILTCNSRHITFPVQNTF